MNARSKSANVVSCGSTTQPPAGSGHGVGNWLSCSGAPAWDGTNSDAGTTSVGVISSPSKVPVTTNSPQRVPLRCS